MSEVTVGLKNAPPQGVKWQLNVFNASKTDYRFLQNLPMDGIAKFTIPGTWDFPLPVMLAVFNAINQTIYSVNSYHPEFEGYNPRAVIRLPGDWDFNFQTASFEYAYKGTITGLVLKYDGSESPIPVKDKIPQSKGWVFFNIRNDITEPELGGAQWKITDPDNIIIEEDIEYHPDAFWPGESRQISSSLFNLDKVGDYYLKVEMVMTKDRIVVDRYEGPLCTVIPAEAGTILKIHTDVSEDARGLVHVLVRNDMPVARQMGISWVVQDPDGLNIEKYSAWEDWPFTGGGKEHEFIGGRFDIKKIGDWTINVSLFMNPASPLLVDSYSGVLLTVTKEGKVIPPEIIPPEEIPPEKEIPIVPILIGGGALLAIAAISMRKGK